MDLTGLLRHAAEVGASDLHVSAGEVPWLRVEGYLQPLSAPPLTAGSLAAALPALMPDPLAGDFARGEDADFALALGEGLRFRVNAYHTRTGPAAAFRRVAETVPSLAELGAPPLLGALSATSQGLVLVTGATGSGKSTTLAAVIDHLNRSSACHILTLEDPVEVVHRSRRALVHQREVGGTGFAGALRSALRADPDVLLVGELRDLETIALALTAAETGHLVLATLHTRAAAQAVDRLVDVFPAGDKDRVRLMLAESLHGVVAQTLVPRRDGRGRVAAFEVLVATPAIRNLIRENKVAQMVSMMQVGREAGMTTFADAFATLVAAGTVAAEAVPAPWRAETESPTTREDPSSRQGRAVPARPVKGLF